MSGTDGPEQGLPMDDPRTPVDDRQVEVINTGEELLVRARAIARQN